MLGWKYDVINLQKYIYLPLHPKYYAISKDEDKDNLLGDNEIVRKLTGF